MNPVTNPPTQPVTNTVMNPPMNPIMTPDVGTQQDETSKLDKPCHTGALYMEPQVWTRPNALHSLLGL